MAHVKVILREDVHNLGDAGDLVRVKPGYARNFLIPQGKATVATESNVREMEHHKRVVAEKVARELKSLETSRQALEKLSLEVSMQAGDEGKLFGSVTSQAVAEMLAEKGFEIDRRKIDLSEPIKQVGDHKVPVRLHRDVIAQVKLTVAAAE